MRRVMLCSLLAGCLSAGAAGAFEGYGEGDGVQRWQGGVVIPQAQPAVNRKLLAGGGIGGVAGALVAGPPGFIVGAAGGVLMGLNAGLKSDLQRLRQEVETLQQAHQHQQQAEQQTRQELQRISTARARELKALAGGVIYSIRFRSDQSLLEPADRVGLQHLAMALLKVESLHLKLHAHADGRGGEQYNRQLSAARASAVRKVLVTAGVATERIQTHLHGEQEARYPLDDREGLGYDRRLEIHFDYRERP